MNSKERSQIIIKSGYFFIATNFLLATFNLVVGLVAGSLAITSDAAHSLIDAISGFIVIIGEKLAGHKKFKQNRAKIERLSTVFIALIILAAFNKVFISYAHQDEEKVKSFPEGLKLLGVEHFCATKMVLEVGLEPTKPEGERFTVSCHCH